MRAAHAAGDEVADRERRQDFAGRREVHLHAHQHDRVVLARVLAGDVVQARGRHRRRLLAGRARPDRFDDVALGIAQERGDVVEILGRVEFDDAVAVGAVHVHDHEAEAAAQVGRQDQPRRVHRVGEGEVERQVVGAGIGLVGGEEEEGLVRAFVELDLGDRRAHAVHVAGERVLEQVLAGAVQTLLLGHCGRRHERVPGELVHFRVAAAARMRHQDRDVVAGVRDAAVDEQAGAVARDRFAHRAQEFL